MKTTTCLVGQPLAAGKVKPALDLSIMRCGGSRAIAQPQLEPDGTEPGEVVKHILLGSPSAVRQTIHLLHKLGYAETVLWSPIMTVEEQMIITPAQGEAMSLLRRLAR